MKAVLAQMIYLKPRAPLANGQGFALLSVLVILAILTPLVVNLSYKTRVQMTGVNYYAGKIKSRQIAKAGLESAMLVLKKDKNNFDSATEEWGQFESLSRFSSGFFSDGAFAGRIEDESSKININKLVDSGAVNIIVKEQLFRLFEKLDTDTDIIDAMVDWIDVNNEVELMGAESDYYNTQDNPYYAKSGPLDSVYELRLIKGVSNENFFGGDDRPGLGALLTAFGKDSKVNINTASYEILLSLSTEMEDSIVEEIITHREEEPFTNTSEIEETVGRQDVYNSIRNRVKFDSAFFSIYIRGSFDEITTDLKAVVEKKNGKVKIIYLREV